MTPMDLQLIFIVVFLAPIATSAWYGTLIWIKFYRSMTKDRSVLSRPNNRLLEAFFACFAFSRSVATVSLVWEAATGANLEWYNPLDLFYWARLAINGCIAYHCWVLHKKFTHEVQ